MGFAKATGCIQIGQNMLNQKSGPLSKSCQRSLLNPQQHKKTYHTNLLLFSCRVFHSKIHQLVLQSPDLPEGDKSSTYILDLLELRGKVCLKHLERSLADNRCSVSHSYFIRQFCGINVGSWLLKFGYRFCWK